MDATGSRSHKTRASWGSARRFSRRTHMSAAEADATIAIDPIYAEWIQKVQRDGMALAEAPPNVKASRQVVLAAVQKNGDALQHAAASVRADREVVLIAVHGSASVGQSSRWGAAFDAASKELQVDRAVMTLVGKDVEDLAAEIEGGEHQYRYSADTLEELSSAVAHAASRGFITAELARRISSIIGPSNAICIIA